VTLSLGIPFCGGAQFRCIIGPQQAEAFSNNGDAMMNSSSCRYRMGGNICDTEGRSRYWLLITISALLLLENILRLDAAYQMGACSHYPAWPLDMNNTAEAMVDFQEFIHNWQFDRERCQRSGIITRTEGGGFGISIVLTNMKNFFMSMELGKIYRPLGHYFWADQNASSCTHGMDTLDCYHEVLSGCNVKGLEHTMKDVDPRATEVGRAIYPSNVTDMCMLGNATKKPMVWVLGQMIHYETRLSKDMLPLVTERIDKVMHQQNRSKTGLVLAVHVRAGKPDRQRRVLAMDEYMKVIDQKATELASKGQHIETVYLASQHHESSFVSIEHMNQLYPRRFSYSILPITPQNGQVC
jgi:hypothetical protein